MKIVVAAIACGQRQHFRNARGVGGEQVVRVKLEKQLEGHECDALIPVYEGVIASDRDGIDGSELRNIDLS
jgi:hypothetical protein